MSGGKRVSDAVWTAFSETLRFIVVPLILVDLVTRNYPQLATAFLDDIQMFVLFFGGMIVASSTMEAAHRPGTYKRLMFGLVALFFVAVWLFVVLGGGIAEFTYGPYFVRFDMTKIVYIVIGGVSLKVLLVVMTFSSGRRAEIERARKHRVEESERRRSLAAKANRARLEAMHANPFEDMSAAEFEVTADHSIGFTPAPHLKDLPKGFKICEVCGAQSPMKDYVCRNCGSWFPPDTVI